MGMQSTGTAAAEAPVGLPEDLRPPLSPPQVEAERCLGCGGPYAPAPCTVACPADIDVPGFVGAVAAGDDAAAARTIFADNLLSVAAPDGPVVDARVDGRYRLTHEPPERVPIDEWLRPQGRFRHLLAPEHRSELDEVQRRVDADWDELVARCRD